MLTQKSTNVHTDQPLPVQEYSRTHGSPPLFVGVGLVRMRWPSLGQRAESVVNLYTYNQVQTGHPHGCHSTEEHVITMELSQEVWCVDVVMCIYTWVHRTHACTNFASKFVCANLASKSVCTIFASKFVYFLASKFVLANVCVLILHTTHGRVRLSTNILVYTDHPLFCLGVGMVWMGWPSMGQVCCEPIYI